MIKEWIVTGDTHGDMKRFNSFDINGDPKEVGIIILGDAGCNYYLNKKDEKTKDALDKTGMNFYCVRGNHEARPETIDSMHIVFDEDVCGDVYIEDAHPQIKYFLDGGIYTINEHKTLVIGGAYSVDKWYRLTMGYRWFANELLTADEMVNISAVVDGMNFDFVLTHTCPYSWEPTDLFLSMIDQSTVDESMEKWLDELKDKISWKVWLFGHFHADRAELPGVEMFYRESDLFEDIWTRWTNGEELPWYFPKGPKFDLGV